jgi:hypothetical protein
VGVAAGTNIVATSLDTFDECKEKYNDVVEHIRAFEKVGGTVLHKVCIPTDDSLFLRDPRAKFLLTDTLLPHFTIFICSRWTAPTWMVARPSETRSLM